MEEEAGDGPAEVQVAAAEEEAGAGAEEEAGRQQRRRGGRAAALGREGSRGVGKGKERRIGEEIRWEVGCWAVGCFDGLIF